MTPPYVGCGLRGQPDETARDDPDNDDEAGEDGAQHPLARCHDPAEGSSGEAAEQAAGDEQSDEPTRPDIACWPRWRPEGGDVSGTNSLSIPGFHQLASLTVSMKFVLPHNKFLKSSRRERGDI